MSKRSRTRNATEMSPDAYAGFLRLLLTPTSRVLRPSSELDAYLTYLNDREPLSEETRRILGQQTQRAA